MATLKIKVDDETYEIDPENLTLGESWHLERDYGIDVSEPLRGAGGLIGLLVVAMRRGDPALTEKQARERVESLTDERVEVIKEPVAAAPKAASAGKPRKPGKGARTPAGSGPQD